MKLRTKLPLFTSVTVLTSILLIAFTSIYNFRMQAEKDIEHFRDDEIDNIKDQLKDIVNIAYKMIEATYNETNEQSVREHYGFGVNDTIADFSVSQLVFNRMTYTLENLRTLRFGTDGYLWINRYDPPHEVVMHATMQHLEGAPHVFYIEQSDVNMYDAYSALIKSNNGEGYLKYSFYKPDAKAWVPKISFIKLFEPMGWVIGTGVYEDYIDKEVFKKKEDLDKRVNFLIRVTIIIGIVLVVIATVILYYFGNSVSKPIQVIENQLFQMSRGL
ncbi:MAG: cache domain-containing protein, partial [Bacteroidales bacterium]|nr:cache domain-containing protein [Bacteroidales bacterium]